MGGPSADSKTASLEGVADARDGFLPSGIARICRTPRASDLRASFAIQVRFSRFRSTVQQGPVERQGTQIVQSWLTLDDFLQ